MDLLTYLLTLSMVIWHLILDIIISPSGVTREGGGERVADRPGWQHPGGDTWVKMWAEITNNTGETTSKGGSCEETTAKKVTSFYQFAECDD